MKKTNKQFIEEANIRHDFKYDYSKTQYINKREKVCIICPKHGEFWQEASSHLKGCGCPKCGKESSQKRQSLNTEQFIERAKKVHGDKYDYSKTEYINSSTKICIICPIHGEFWQTPTEHLRGRGCKKCGDLSVGIKNSKITTDEFIERAKKVHGDKYDYSKTEYISPRKKICIIDKEFGEFWMMPYAHLNGQGCPSRRGEKISKANSKSKEKFIEDAIQIHGDKYDYSKTEYINSSTKICIICPIHGEFWQRPKDHTQGIGCPVCKSSHLEMEIKNWLDNNNVEYVYQYRDKIFGLQSLDFYLPKYNIAIECQGEQHFRPVKYFGGIKEYNKVKKLDKIKKEICDKNGIRLIYYVRINKYQTNSLNEIHEPSKIVNLI